MSHDTLITPELGGFRVSYNKSELRNQVRNARKVHPVNTNFEYLLTVTEIMKAEVIASYFPTENEPSPITLNEELINLNKIVLLPRITSNSLEFAKYSGENLTKNGIFNEPAGPKFNEEIQVILVPALAVDKTGIRLGQGGGYYDRFLPSTKAFRIALINEDEFVESIEADSHDQKVDAVALASHLVRISK